MGIENQLERLARVTPRIPPCRCCGGALGILDGIGTAVAEGIGLHTRCIPTHWGEHSSYANASRCREFGRKS